MNEYSLAKVQIRLFVDGIMGCISIPVEQSLRIMSSQSILISVLDFLLITFQFTTRFKESFSIVVNVQRWESVSTMASIVHVACASIIIACAKQITNVNMYFAILIRRQRYIFFMFFILPVQKKFILLFTFFSVMVYMNVKRQKTNKIH